MFKISTKGDYGLLLLAALAKVHADGKSFVALKEIASAKHLSLPYISQIVNSLKRAGLVESKEGLGGGYRLSRSPDSITVIEILEALEGPVAPVKCCTANKEKCGAEPYCEVKSTWHEAKKMMIEFLRNKTLKDIC